MQRRSTERITERSNPASASLDTKSTREILTIINQEDRRVAPAVAETLPQIACAVDMAAEAIRRGGRMIYLGAGTSGRLGVLDAAECLPTFGSDRVIALLAGGQAAAIKSTEEAEDDPEEAKRDLRRVKLRGKDVLVGLSAGGRAPYVLGGMRYARSLGAKTIGLTVNPAAPMKRLADVLIAPVVGPEVITGSSRMKAGTAQKLVLNMLSTATMVRLGRVLSNWMIDVQLTNQKLRDRGKRILMNTTGTTASKATRALKEADGNLPVAILMLIRGINHNEALERVESSENIASLLRSSMENKAGKRL